MFKIFKTRPKKENISSKEVPISHFLPYIHYLNDHTIVTKDYNLLQVIQLSGFAFETKDEEELDSNKNLRNMLFKNMELDNVVIYLHTIRKKINTTKSGYNLDNFRSTKKDFLNYFNYKWQQRYLNRDFYTNSFYITILHNSTKSGVSLIKKILDGINAKTSKLNWEKNIKNIYYSINEVTTKLVTAFDKYHPKLLKIRKKKNGYVCEMLEFLGTIVNLGISGEMRIPRGRIDEYLGQGRLFFGKKLLEARVHGDTKYAGMISIQEYSSNTYAGMLDKFLRMPFEFIITQSFIFQNRRIAINKLQLQQNRMIQAEDKAVSQIAEITEALDLATSGTIGFGEHHLTMMCIENKLETVEQALSFSAIEFTNAGMQPVRETRNMELCYWGQLPGNLDFIVRGAMIHTVNLAGLASFHSYPLGKQSGNHWGEHVALLDTNSSTPYYFNFHVNDVGHSLIIGPTGGGKTVLMNFLCAQACKFLPRMFLFDKDRGAEIFVRAIEGIYTILNPLGECGLNPLQLDDTSENRAFLLEWLESLVLTQGGDINSDERKILYDAIEGSFRLEKKDRKLNNIVPFLGLNVKGSLASRIAIWHGNGSYAKIFDNDTDKIDFDRARIFGFEMGNLLGNNKVLGPVLLYLFHRIRISLDGSNTMLVLDEAWALIDNPFFAPKIKDWLKVLRKLNTFVIFATQSVEDAANSAISDTLVQQTTTQIFLPNLKATSAYRKVFMLSEKEFEIIKNIDPSSRYFLVKQGTQSIMARVNLSGMDDIISVLSGSAKTVKILYEIMKTEGVSTKDWIKLFYKRIEELKAQENSKDE